MRASETFAKAWTPDKKIDRIDQLGFVVTDLEAAAMHWAKTCGVGPFFVSEHVKYDRFTYRGQDTPIDLTLAFSYIGSLMIELILQHNDAPSVYLDLKNSPKNGLVHMAKYCEDLDEAAAGFAPTPIVQYSLAHDGVETIYMETGFHNGGLIEFIKTPNTGKPPRRDLIREAAQNWDGSRPIRLMNPDDPYAAF